jgi:TRAP-type C4-dicarboxylate transport system substrate-binding protein
MKALRTKSWVCVAAAAAMMVMGARGVARAEDRRIATLAPSGSAWMNILEEAARRTEKATEGRITTKFYPGGTQGDEKDVVRKMKLGQLDGAALTTVGLSLIYPGIRVLQLPFMFQSEEEIDYVRGKMWSYFQKKFAAEGFELLYPGDVGWVYLYAKSPMKDQAALSKIKMWAWTDDPIVRAYFDKLKINSVPLGVPEVLSALKTGRIDGCYGPPLSTVALQWYTEVSYVTERPTGYTVGAMVVRKELWDKASAADRKAQLSIGDKTGKFLVKRVRTDNERALKAMSKSGIKTVPVTDAMMTELEQDAQKVWEELAGQVYSKKELEMVLKYRAEFRAKK